MANPGGFLAHLIKLVTTIICLRYVNDKHSIMTVRAFQIFLIHSILGMFRFGNFTINFYLDFNYLTQIINLLFFYYRQYSKPDW